MIIGVLTDVDEAKRPLCAVRIVAIGEMMVSGPETTRKRTKKCESGVYVPLEAVSNVEEVAEVVNVVVDVGRRVARTRPFANWAPDISHVTVLHVQSPGARCGPLSPLPQPSRPLRT